MLFEHDGDLLAVYRIAPQTILRVNLAGAGPIDCKPVHESPWASAGSIMPACPAAKPWLRNWC